MKLSIIIVNYRSWDCLEKCLESLLPELPGKAWEVIVIDNDSDDGNFEQFKARYGNIIFRQAARNGGFAYGCNQGAALAQGDTLLFLNPDVVAQPGSIPALLEVKQKNPGIAILTSGQLNGRGRQRKVFDMFPDKLTWFRTVKFLMRWLWPGRYPDPRKPLAGLVECDWVSGSVLMVSAADFKELGGWREDYWMYVEDCDLCLRARRNNKQVACSGDVWMTHYHGGASRQNRAISILTRTETVVSKHLYVQLNFSGLNRWLNHLCVFLAVVPKMLIYSIFDLLTLRRIELLRTRSSVFVGVLGHYAHVIRHRSWRSRLVAEGVQGS